MPMADKPDVMYVWLQWPFPDGCPRCGQDCCSATGGEPGEPAFCAGRCDSAGHHDDSVPDDDTYNNEPCWHMNRKEDLLHG